MLLDTGSAIVAQTPAGTRKPLLDNAHDAVYSPDGTFVAFARGGDVWLANADGSGERRLVTTPRCRVPASSRSFRHAAARRSSTLRSRTEPA
jgi:hypothetical protein